MSSYIGKEPTYGVFIMQSATGDGSTTTITLTATSADATQLMVSVGGLLQKPRTAYSINTAGTILTFSEAPASGIEIFIVFLGKQLTGPRIMGDAITSQSALGAQPAADDEFLLYDTSSSDLKKVDFSYMQAAMGDITEVQGGTGVTVTNGTGPIPSVAVDASQTQITALGTIGSLVATTADINGGTIDATAIGGATPAAGAFTTVSATTAIPVGSGGTGASTDSAARTALGVAIGSDVQAYSANTAVTNAAQEFTAQQNFNNTALTFDATQDWALAANQVATLTLTANTTFDAPTEMVDGAFYSLIIIQDGTGGWTAAWNAVFKWAAGTAPTLTTAASAKDIFVWRSDGTNMYEVGRQLNVS